MLPRLLCAAILAALVQRPEVSGRMLIDAVVLNDHDQPVGGLTQKDFTVKDDGVTVKIESFNDSTELQESDRVVGKSVVLLLDDTAVPPQYTPIVQNIANEVFKRKSDADRVSVVRLNKRDDEVVYDRNTSLMRIAEYRAGSTPFFGRETYENVLDAVAKISRQVGKHDGRRTAIVCIGSPGVYNMPWPARETGSLLWEYWVKALRASAEANTAVYVIDPRGLRAGALSIPGDGLVTRTGGRLFANSNDFDQSVTTILHEVGRYYVLGYTPPRSAKAGKKELHDIEVTTSRPGLHVNARRNRG